MAQLEMQFSSPESPIEIGQFSYIRPKAGDVDYEEWKQLFVMFVAAQYRNGRELKDDLADEGKSYADMLHAQLYGMKAAEMMVGC